MDSPRHPGRRGAEVADGAVPRGNGVPRLATLGYHDVTDDPTASGFQRFSASPYKHRVRVFREHLQAMADAGRTPSLVTAIDFAQAGDYLLLTFDDGGCSALHICDELERRGWRGHFLVTTSLTGQPGFLDRAAVRRIHDAGHVVGSHSHTHPDVFRRQRLSEMVREWRVSCDRLATWTGAACTVASVPGGDISETVLESAGLGGLRYLFTSEPDLTARRIDACQVLGRVAIKASTSSRRVRALAAHRGWTRAGLERRCVVVARTALPPVHRLYLRLYARAVAGALPRRAPPWPSDRGVT